MSPAAWSPKAWRRSAGVRLLRDNVVIHEGTLKTLKRFRRDEVNSAVRSGNAAWPLKLRRHPQGRRHRDLRVEEVAASAWRRNQLKWGGPCGPPFSWPQWRDRSARQYRPAPLPAAGSVPDSSAAAQPPVAARAVLRKAQGPSPQPGAVVALGSIPEHRRADHADIRHRPQARHRAATWIAPTSSALCEINTGRTAPGAGLVPCMPVSARPACRRSSRSLHRNGFILKG